METKNIVRLIFKKVALEDFLRRIQALEQHSHTLSNQYSSLQMKKLAEDKFALEVANLKVLYNFFKFPKKVDVTDPMFRIFLVQELDRTDFEIEELNLDTELYDFIIQKSNTSLSYFLIKDTINKRKEIYG